MGKKRSRAAVEDIVENRPVNKLVKVNTLNDTKKLINDAKGLIQTVFVNPNINTSSSSSSTTTTSVVTNIDPEQGCMDDILGSINEVLNQLISDKQEINTSKTVPVLKQIRGILEAAKNLVKTIYFDEDDTDSDNDDDLDAAIAAGEDPKLVYEDEIVGNLNEIADRIINIGQANSCEYEEEYVSSAAAPFFIAPDSTSSTNRSSSTSASAASSNTNINVDLSKIKYAPVPKPLTGQYSIGAAVIGWADKKTPPNSASGVLQDINRMYLDFSHGEFGFNKRDSKVVRVRYKFGRKNLNKAEAQAQREIGRHDIYVFEHGGARKFSNAGSNKAHVINSRAIPHETGHILDALQKGKSLGHATSTMGGDRSDNYSFMGFGPGVPRLTLPQLFNQGWASQSESLPAEKAIGQHELGDPAIDYPIETLYSKEHDKGCVRGVRVVRPGVREIFISYLPAKDEKNQGKLTFFAHYRTGGGSQLFGRFNDQQVQLEENLYVKKIGTYGNGNPVLRFSSTPITSEPSVNLFAPPPPSKPKPNKNKKHKGR